MNETEVWNIGGNLSQGNTKVPVENLLECLLVHLLTYLLTPWCRVLLEKLTGLQLVKKFPTFYGTRWFITALTSVRHLSLSWANPIQSTYPHPTSWRSILILSTHLRLGLPPSCPLQFPNWLAWRWTRYGSRVVIVVCVVKILLGNSAATHCMKAFCPRGAPLTVTACFPPVSWDISLTGDWDTNEWKTE